MFPSPLDSYLQTPERDIRTHCSSSFLSSQLRLCYLIHLRVSCSSSTKHNLCQSAHNPIYDSDTISKIPCPHTPLCVTRPGSHLRPRTYSRPRSITERELDARYNQTQSIIHVLHVARVQTSWPIALWHDSLNRPWFRHETRSPCRSRRRGRASSSIRFCCSARWSPSNTVHATSSES